MIYKGICELVVKNKTEAVLDEIKQRGIAFDDLSVIEKARIKCIEQVLTIMFIQMGV